MLVDQPGQHSPGRMLLLPWRNQILPQWWLSRRQRRSHRAAVHAMSGGELADRQILASMIPPDSFEQLDPGPHFEAFRQP
jgi:hypothetical protein